MKSFIGLLVIFSIISIAYGAHHLNEGLAYTPLNEPGLDVQGGFKGLDSHDHLFYCDVGAARENFASDSDYYESCAKLKREVHPFLPVTVASTGEGKPIIFFASNEVVESGDGAPHPMKYVICDDMTCSSFSEAKVLEGFNGKHALSYDHMWVSGQKILVLGGTGRFFSNPKPSPNTYVLQYAFCTSESCDSFVSKSFVGEVPAIQATLLTPKVVSISVYGPKYHQKVAFYYTSNSRYELLSGTFYTNSDLSSNFKEGFDFLEIGIPFSTFPVTFDTDAPFGDQYKQNQAGLPMSNILDVDYTALVRCNNPPNCFVEDLEVDYLYSGGSNIAYKYPDRTPFNTVFEDNKRFFDDPNDEELGLASQTAWNFRTGKGIPRWTVATLPNPSLIVGTSQGLWVGLINYKNQKFTQSQIINPNSQLNKEVFWGYTTKTISNNKRDFPDEQTNHGEFEEFAYNSETPSDTGSYLTFIPCGLDGTGCRLSAHLKPYQFDEGYGSNLGGSSFSPLIEQVAYPIPDPHLGWSFAGSRHNWHSASDNSEWLGSNGGIDDNLHTLPTDGYNQVFSPFAAGAAGNGFPASVGVVSDDSKEPSASGWSIVLSVCLSETCDQQVYRYLMDSSALHDNWGTLDDPFSAANEIINHPDGSWTIVLFVQPNSDLSNGVDWIKDAFDGDDLNYFDGSTTTPTSSTSSTSTSTITAPTTDPSTPPSTSWDTSVTADWETKTSTSTAPATEAIQKRDDRIGVRAPPVTVPDQVIGDVDYNDEESAKEYLHISNGAQGSTGKPLFIHCLDDTCSEASISTSSPDLLGSKVPVDIGAYRDILSFSGFTLDPVHDAKLIRVNSNRPHSYAFVGENHEYLLVSVRDIDPKSAVGHSISGNSEDLNLYPSLRFYSTNRYSSPNGQPCSHDNVGTHVVSDGRTYICTRLFIGNNHQVSGISGWVKYYEWVDAGASLATRVFPNIPSGSYNIFDELNNDEPQFPNHFLYPENIASATAYLKNPNDPLSENDYVNDLPTCRNNCGETIQVASQDWCSCACDCDRSPEGCCPDIAQYCPAEVSSGSGDCEFEYGNWIP